jgi:tripartite-type tricarboxylate transporter receptor subunit TctC
LLAPGVGTWGSVGSTPHLSGEIFRLSQGIDMVVVQFNAAGRHPIDRWRSYPDRVYGRATRGTPGQGGLAASTCRDKQDAVADAAPCADHGAVWVKIVTLADVQRHLDDLGFETVVSSPEEFAAEITKQSRQWSKIISDAKIKAG